MKETVEILVLSPNGERKEISFLPLEIDETVVDVLKRCIMMFALHNVNWWSDEYKNSVQKLDIKEMPHSYLWNSANGDVYQVLKPEYDFNKRVKESV